MKIYVAASSQEIDRAKSVIANLRAAGHHITFDWTKDVEKWGSAGDTLTTYERAECAQSDVLGILEADLFWLLAPQKPSTGAWIELGIAIAAHRPAVISPTLVDRTPFACLGELLFHDLRNFEDDEAVFAYVARGCQL